MKQMNNAVWRTTDETHLSRKAVGHQAISGPKTKHSTVLATLNSSLVAKTEEATEAKQPLWRIIVKEGLISEDSEAIRTRRLQMKGRRAAEAIMTSLITMIDRRLLIFSSIQRPAASTHLDRKEDNSRVVKCSRVVNKVDLKATSKGVREATEVAATKVNKEEAVKEAANGVAIKINKVLLSQGVRSVIKEALKVVNNRLTG